MRTRTFLRSTSVAAATCLLAFTGAGCSAVGSTYERPQMAPPAQFRGVASPAAAEVAADVPWWKVFDDPALQVLVRDGIANNLDLKVASARVMESRAVAGIAGSYLYPNIDVGFGNTQEQKSRVGDPKIGETLQPDRTYSNWVLNGQLSWEIDLFGKLRRGKEAAVAQYLASEEGRKSVMVTLVADIATTYFFLRELDLELAIAKRTLTINDDTVAYYTRRLAGGVSNRLEVDQAKANRAVTAATIPTLERQIAIAENALSVLLGRPPASITRVALTEADGLPPQVPSGMPAQLLERRPDIRQAELQLVASNANIGAAKALFFPTIGLTGTAGSISSSFSNLLSPASLIWSFGSALFQPIFNGGRLKNNVAVMQARFDASMALYQKSALNAYREVADSLVTIEKLAVQRKELETGVEALRDATGLARSRYDNGLSSYLEVLIADQTLFTQELQLAQVRGAQLRALAEFYRALGGGWQLEESKPAQPVK